MKRAVVVALCVLAATPCLAQTREGADTKSVAPSAGPQGPEQGDGRRQLWMLPVKGQTALMRATVLRPDGPGPFPLVVINHGSTQNAARRAEYATPEYAIAARWFLARGYAVVVPQRLGHGQTGGPYLENQGRCAVADYRAAGLGTADGIQSAIDDMTAQPFIQKAGVVVVGHSAGGWGALALASRNPPMVKAAINFAGGRGGRVNGEPDNNCAPDRLVAAAGAFGSTARIPTLWLYSENDSYFGPELAQRLYQAFSKAGGRAEYHMLPPAGRDGHQIINNSDAAARWRPLVEAFLAKR